MVPYCLLSWHCDGSLFERDSNHEDSGLCFSLVTAGCSPCVCGCTLRGNGTISSGVSGRWMGTSVLAQSCGHGRRDFEIVLRAERVVHGYSANYRGGRIGKAESLP